MNTEKDEHDTIKEYKRTCHECGKVWHVLAAREEALQIPNTTDQCDTSLNECAMCGTNKSAKTDKQKKREIPQANDELIRLKVCPECFGGNYDEETILHTKE